VPTYEVDVGGETYEVESATDLTDDQVLAAARGGEVTPPLTPEVAPADEPFVSRYGATGIRAASGAVAGYVGAIPSLITTPAAALIGGAGEALAQAREVSRGERAGFNLGSIGVEAGISAVPLGRLARGATVAARAGTEALKIGAVEAVGAQARSLAETGELASAGTTATAAALGGAAGAVAGALTRPTARTVGEAEQVLEQVAKTEGRALGADADREALQLGLFDSAGHVNLQVADYLAPTTRGASVRATGQVADAVIAEGKEAAAVLSRTRAAAGDERLYRQVAEAFDTGEIAAPELARELSDRGLSMSEFVADYYVPSIRRAGRQLQQLSQVRKFIDESADPAARKLLEDMSSETSSNRVLAFLQKLDDTRRGLLVSQVKTGVRNAISQGAAYGTDLVEQAASQLLGGRGDFFGSVEAFTRAWGRKESRETVKRMLKYRRDLYRQLGQFEYEPNGSFVNDIPVLNATLGRFTRATTWINRYQEEFFRRAKFDATVRQGLKAAGVDLEKALADPKLIPDALLDEATESALELTFAGANPGGLKKLIAGAQMTRPISTFVTTFPRYMANAATFVARRSPLGLVRLATQHGRQDAATVMAEAASGSLLFGGALALRSSESAGEKWYEVKRGDKRFDLRGFAGPFAPYLFAADAFRQYMDTGSVNFTGQDYIEGTIAMNRVTGTAATMLSFLTQRMDDQDAWQKFASKMAGEWFAGFATPAKGIKDVLTATGVEEPELRDVREEPFLGPIKAAIPGLQETLPKRVSLTTGAPIPVENVGLSALLGLSSRTTNAVEAELNRLGISQLDVAPKTGIPKADREMYRRVGKVVSAVGPRVIGTRTYQALPDEEKALAFRELFEEARGAARRHLEATRPKLSAATQLRRQVTKAERRALEAKGVDVGALVEQFAAAEPETDGAAAPPAPPARPAPPAPGGTSALDEGTAPATPFDDLFAEAASLTGVPVPFLKAIGHTETRFRNVQGPPTRFGRARGVMQILPSTFAPFVDEAAGLLGHEPKIDEPRDNIVVSALLIRDILQKTEDAEVAAREYHGGPDTRIHGPKTAAYGQDVARKFRSWREGA